MIRTAIHIAGFALLALTVALIERCADPLSEACRDLDYTTLERNDGFTKAANIVRHRAPYPIDARIVGYMLIQECQITPRRTLRDATESTLDRLKRFDLF
jgi:hypothetical protein